MAEPLTVAVVAGLGGVTRNARLAAEEARAGIESALANAQDAKKWPGLAGTVVEALAGELVTPLGKLLSEGWKQDKAMQSALKGNGGGPPPSGEVVLHTHSITSTLRPKATIVLGSLTIATIEFVVRVKIDLKALRLVVKRAVWTGVKAGEVSGSVTVAYAVTRPQAAEIPVMRPRTFSYQAEKEFPLPAGGIQLV